jgi:hypothetical protein
MSICASRGHRQRALLGVHAGKHEVTDQQKIVGLGGLEGSIDAIVDGNLVDVKSASPFSFNAVRNGSLTSNKPEDDPWGYRDQASFYTRADNRNDFEATVVLISL